MKLVINSADTDCDLDYFILADSKEEESILNNYELGKLLCINNMLVRFNGKDIGTELYCVSKVGQTFDVYHCSEISK